MKFSFCKGLYDGDGDCFDDGLYACIGDKVMVRFEDADELEGFANQILGAMKEIKENYYVGL